MLGLDLRNRHAKLTRESVFYLGGGGFAEKSVMLRTVERAALNEGCSHLVLRAASSCSLAVSIAPADCGHDGKKSSRVEGAAVVRKPIVYVFARRRSGLLTRRPAPGNRDIRSRNLPTTILARAVVCNTTDQ